MNPAILREGLGAVLHPPRAAIGARQAIPSHIVIRVDACRTLEGTDSGQFLGLPPTGKSFRIPAVFLYELKDGQIARERRIYDFTGLLVQIGLLKAKPAV